MADNLSHIKRTSQAMDGFSFDEKYLMNAVIPMVENEAGNAIVRAKQGASEATLLALLAASGGSTYNYIQSASDAIYKYYGYASSTGWKFKRKTLATGVWEVASGVGDYDTSWADKADKSYTYV